MDVYWLQQRICYNNLRSAIVIGCGSIAAMVAKLGACSSGESNGGVGSCIVLHTDVAKWPEDSTAAATRFA